MNKTHFLVIFILLETTLLISFFIPRSEDEKERKDTPLPHVYVSESAVVSSEATQGGCLVIDASAAWKEGFFLDLLSTTDRVAVRFLFLLHHQNDPSLINHQITPISSDPSISATFFGLLTHPPSPDHWRLSLCTDSLSLHRNDVPIVQSQHFSTINPLVFPPITRVGIFCIADRECFQAAQPNALTASLRPSSLRVKMPHFDRAKSEITLFIGVMSAAQYREKRDGIRDSWLNERAIRAGDVAVRFFVGIHADPAINAQVVEEAGRFGDVEVVKIADRYDAVAHKTKAIIRYAARHHVAAAYTMKCDDDSFVFLGRILHFLASLPPESRYIYAGNLEFGAHPVRDEVSPSFLSWDDFPRHELPPFAHGPGYIVSRDLCEFFEGEFEKQKQMKKKKKQNGEEEVNDDDKDDEKDDDMAMLRLEDVSLALWVEHARKAHRMPVSYISDARFLIEGCRRDALVGHYIAPERMRQIWAQMQKTPSDPCAVPSEGEGREEGEFEFEVTKEIAVLGVVCLFVFFLGLYYLLYRCCIFLRMKK